MSGFLDNKKRIMDVIMTNEGKRQLSQGRLRVTYASFSDASSVYDSDVTSGSADISNRIYLEAASLPHDSIVPEADDSGRLMPFGMNGDILLRGGQLFRDVLTPTTGSVVSGSSKNLMPITGSEFSSLMDGILTGSIDNLDRLSLISTYDSDVDGDGFVVSPGQVQFVLNKFGPISDSRVWTRELSSMNSIFSDPRFSQLPNFQYLPPINRVADKTIDKSIEANVKFRRIADYPAWGTVLSKKDAFNDLMIELTDFEKRGFCRRISIDPTTKENNLMCQMFEITDDIATKLDVVHFGRFNTQESKSSVIDVFFAGKIKIDDNGAQTFVHIFTLVFE